MLKEPVGIRVGEFSTEHSTTISLLKLISVHRIIKKIGKVGEEVESVGNGVGVYFIRIIAVGLSPFAREGVARSSASISGIDISKRRESA